jgi:hypothetical protein
VKYNQKLRLELKLDWGQWGRQRAARGGSSNMCEASNWLIGINRHWEKMAVTAEQRDASGIHTGIHWLPLDLILSLLAVVDSVSAISRWISLESTKNICGHDNFPRIPPDSNGFCWPLLHRNSILLFYLNLGDETLHALKPPNLRAG